MQNRMILAMFSITGAVSTKTFASPPRLATIHANT